MKKLIAIDGNSLMFRAYYAIQTAMTGRDGTPTNAIHGFLAMLLKLVDMRPDYMLAAFDISGGTFRHDTYPDYKAGRRETPEDLRPQFPALKQLLKDMGVTVCECYRYEADDILGTVSRMAEERGIQSLLVTGDRDALQLISNDTHVLLTKKGITETVEYDEKTLMEDYGLAPKRMIDLKALMGDNSDNIPGVKGIGEKTAKNLLFKYGDLENVLANAENEKGALQKKLLEGMDSARMSYEIGTICRNAPIDITPEDCAFDVSTLAGGIPMLSKLGLRSNIARIKAISDQGSKPAQDTDEPTSSQPGDEELEANGTERPAYEVKDYKEITTREELASAADSIKGCSLIAVDLDDGLGVAADNGLCFTIRAGGDLLNPGLMPEEIFAGLKAVFEDEKIGKLVFDGKKLMTALAPYGIALNGLRFDLTVADYLLNALNPAKTLDALAEGVGVMPARGLAKADQNSPGARAAEIQNLYILLDYALKEKQLETLYYGVELPLVRVLFDMEQTGFAVDADELRTLGVGMSTRIKELEADIHKQAGHAFNILSPKQLGTVLFEEMKLPPQKKTKTGWSTDSEVLENLSGFDPIVDMVIEYRFLTKLKSTFIDAMLDKISSDGRIHTTLNQNVTATGRISSAEPNLQNIPVRTEQGSMIRKAFVASPGCVLVGADYSQIELRVLAHMSGDEALKAAFLSGADIHTRTAAEVFGVDTDMVTKQMRSAAKAVNFGIVYGISEFGLSNQLGIPIKTAGEYIKKYLDRFTGVHNYMKRSVEQGRERGYAVTVTGRRRELPELKSGNHNTRSFGERVAMNMPVQGSAADIIKLAMLRVHDALEHGGYKAKLVLQIHDELIIDCPADEVEEVKKLLHDCMTGMPVPGELPETTAIGESTRLTVPLIAEVSEGRSWFDTK